MLSELLTCLRHFQRSESGVIGVIFGLALIPMMGLTSVAVDYGRVSATRSRIAAAADAAALATVKATGAFEQRKRVGEGALRGNIPFNDPNVEYTIAISQVIKDNVDTGARVVVSGRLKTSMMNVIGIQTIAFSVSAEATNDANELTDVVFVLDTTDSMQGSRLATLKSSTTALLSDFESRRGSPDQIRVAVVPFAQYVNIGMSRRRESWLDVRDDYQTPVVETCSDVLETRWINCRTVTIPAVPADPNRTCMVDGVLRSCPRAATPARQVQQCDAVRGPRIVRECNRTGGQWFRWTGCVGSRNAPNHTIDGNYGVRVPGLMNTSCGSEVLDWTTSLAGARSMINGLTTAGETYLPSGLIWGWRMLSTQAPFVGRTGTDALPVRRYMIFVTDGQNTKSLTAPTHNGNNTADANATTLTICRNMAADTRSAIKMYTIAFEINNPTVKDLLKQCSTLNNGEFFDASNAAELLSALKNIGGQMTNLRLTR
jgi:Flp pilus assembly protein TadG